MIAFRLCVFSLSVYPWQMWPVIVGRYIFTPWGLDRCCFNIYYWYNMEGFSIKISYFYFYFCVHTLAQIFSTMFIPRGIQKFTQGNSTLFGCAFLLPRIGNSVSETKLYGDKWVKHYLICLCLSHIRQIFICSGGLCIRLSAPNSYITAVSLLRATATSTLNEFSTHQLHLFICPQLCMMLHSGNKEHFSSSQSAVNIKVDRHVTMEVTSADHCCSQVDKQEWG